jgi:hypothetical protein
MVCAHLPGSDHSGAKHNLVIGSHAPRLSSAGSRIRARRAITGDERMPSDTLDSRADLLQVVIDSAATPVADNLDHLFHPLGHPLPYGARLREQLDVLEGAAETIATQRPRARPRSTTSPTTWRRSRLSSIRSGSSTAGTCSAPR